ncbi:hypothetical protein ABZS76_20930 [Streptomyces sp. NPDC005562]|uniref:hypothetical protein n=1 Tax=Streptomyces sp. NPDC005562 TaxID=3154890 RepID=UPI0033AA3B8F
MAWEEWEQVKADISAQRSVQMQLNGAPSDNGVSKGGGADDLRSDSAAWNRTSEQVGSLRSNISTALRKLDEGHGDFGVGSGCLTTSAEHKVRVSWQRYAKDLSERCRDLAEVLEKTGRNQLKTDEAVKAEIEKLALQYKDTSALGGQAPKDR